jgi:hypothetical protein
MPFDPALPELFCEVEDALRATAEAARLLDTVNRFRAKPGLLRSHLALLLGCERCLERVAARSSWHENGFAKVRLVVRGGYSVRLHIWPRGRVSRGDTNPHGHRWEFASWVAVGAGVDEVYFAEDRGEVPASATYTRCEYGYVDGVRTLTPLGEARLCDADRMHHPSDATYACLRDVIHTVTPAGRDLVATVVVQGPVLSPKTPVYLADSRSEPSYRDMSPDDLRDLLEGVAALLPAADPVGALEAVP